MIQVDHDLKILKRNIKNQKQRLLLKHSIPNVEKDMTNDVQRFQINMVYLDILNKDYVQALADFHELDRVVHQ